MDSVAPTPQAPPSTPPIQSQPANIIKADINEPLPDLNRQLDDSLKAVFESSNPKEETKSEPVAEQKEFHEGEESYEKKEIPNQVKTDPKKEVKPQTTDLSDPASIADPKNLGKSADGWKNLKSIASKNFEIANQRAQELDTIKKSFAHKESELKKQLEGLQNQVKDLSGYRAAVDIQADPEFISKYEEPITKLTSELKSMLKSRQVADQVIDQIDFSDSAKMSGVIAAIEENSDKIFSKRFARRVEDLLEISDRKGEEIESWQKNSSKFLEEKKQQAVGKKAQYEGQMMKVVDDFTNKKNEDGTPYIPFLSKQEVPESANKDQQKAIETHNTYVDQMQQRLNQIIKAEAPEDRVEIGVAALASQWLKSQLDQTRKELNSAREELKRISSSSSEGDEKAPDTKRESTRPTITDPKSLDLDNALYSHFGRRS